MLLPHPASPAPLTQFSVVKMVKTVRRDPPMLSKLPTGVSAGPTWAQYCVLLLLLPRGKAWQKPSSL